MAARTLPARATIPPRWRTICSRARRTPSAGCSRGDAAPGPRPHARLSRGEPPRDLHAAALAIGGHRTLGEAEIVAQLIAIGRHFAVRSGAEAEHEAHALLAKLVAADLPSAPEQRFDLSEVVNLLALAEAGRAPAVGDWGVATGRRLVTALIDRAPSDASPDMAALPPRRFTVMVARTFDLSQAPHGVRPRLRLPLPIADAQLRALDIATDPPAACLPGRIELRPPPDHEPHATLAARFCFVADPAARLADEPDRTLWLNHLEGDIRVTPRVRALADRLAGANADPVTAIGAFRDYLLDELACGIVHRDRIGTAPATDWVLDHGWYDCRLGAALLAALCRARNIPARLVGGYLLWDAPAEHYWMEAWLPGRGWSPFDLMAWGLSAGGREAGWRGVYAGAIDYRMKTQVFPLLFTGAPGVPMPGPVHRLTRLIDGGAETRFVSAEDGRLLYADAIRIVTA